MISGLSDVEEAGNPSLRNTIKYLSAFGYSLRIFTAMPEDYPNLMNSAPCIGAGIQFKRLPRLFSAVIKAGKGLKDTLGRQRVGGKNSPSGGQGHGTYLREHNPLGRLFYMAFLFIFYLPMELLRTWVCSLRWKPDLLYGVNCQGAVVARVLGGILKVPVVTRFHGVSVSQGDLSRWRRRILLMDEIAGLRAASEAVIVTNDGTGGNRILRMLGVPEGRIHYWMNGVDFGDLALPGSWNRKSFLNNLGIGGKRVLLMVSRLTTWKRVDRGIRCMHALIREDGAFNAVLLIAGDGPQRDELQELAERLGVRESVIFLGSVPHDEIAQYYAVSDVFLSLYDVSNLANPVLEAMSLGLPIVSIDDGSTGGLLISEENCFLCPVDGIEEELPEKVKRLLEDPDLGKRIGENARKTFHEKVLSWEARMRLEDMLIRKIISGRI